MILQLLLFHIVCRCIVFQINVQYFTYLVKEDAMDHCKWRKLIKDVRWSGWVWVGECYFWYRPTRVVSYQRPLNGCVYVCVSQIYWKCSVGVKPLYCLASIIVWFCPINAVAKCSICCLNSSVGLSICRILLVRSTPTLQPYIRGRNKFVIFNVIFNVSLYLLNNARQRRIET